MNNRLSLLLNIVLLVAVGILFYLFFNQKTDALTPSVNLKKDSVSAKLEFSIPKNLAGARVLYVNIDSINIKYQAIKDLSAKANAEAKSLQVRYQTKRSELERRYIDIQQKAQAGTISENDLAKEEADLKAGSDELMTMENQLADVENRAIKNNSLIVEEVSKYFKQYSQEKGIDFILGYGATSTVMYANDSLDITNDVLKALNDAYFQQKGKKK